MSKDKVTRRRFLKGLAAVTGGTVLAACAPQVVKETVVVEKVVEKEVEKVVTAAPTAIPPKAKPTGEFTFWTHAFGVSDKVNMTPVEWMEKKFNEEVGGELGITAIGQPAGEWNQPIKHMAAIAAGSPPDVSFTGRHLTADLAVRGAVVNIDEAVDNAKHFKWDDIWSRLGQDALTWGKKWIVPYSTDTRALYYNKKLLSEAGFDPEKPPETLERMLEMCPKLTKKDEGGRLDTIGYTPSFGNPPVHLAFYSALWCLESATVDSTMTKSTIMDKGEEAMIYLKNLMDAQGGYEDAVAFTKSITVAEGLDAFSGGMVALAMHSNGAYNRYVKLDLPFEWDMAMGPVFEGRPEPFNYDGGGGWITFKTGKQDVAFEFVDWLMDFDVYKEYAIIFEGMPSRVDVGEAWAADDPGRQIFLDTANTVHWIPIYAGIMEEIGHVATMFNNVLIGGNDIVEELEIADGKIQSLLNNWGAYSVPT